ncbi:MAG: hypothetical protein ABI413_08985 [Ktedonobacteraceae bacterium]
MIITSTRPLTRGCITDFFGPTLTLNQLRGDGVVLNKSLVIPVHFGETVNSVEYVQIQHCSSVGEHVQNTDELSFIAVGCGELTTNGETSTIQVGDLILAPRFTKHSIRNTQEYHSLDFLAVEVQTPSYIKHPPTTITALHTRLQPTETRCPALVGPQRVPLSAFTVDLTKYFSGPWDQLSLLELPAGCCTEEYVLPCNENLLVYEGGHATIEVDGNSFMTDEERECRLNAFVPAGITRRIVNRSSVAPLHVLSVWFFQESA